MMKKTLKLASLTFLMFGCAVASEFRPPMSADRGPQRLDMNAERESEGNWELDVYSTAYCRNASKTFTKHGSKTAPLSALIFGKDSFKVSDALPQGLATSYSEEFNNNLASTTLFPRVTYSETGINLGGKLGYRILDGKGLVGIKVNVPLKTVRMERDNNAETAELGGSNEMVVLADQFIAKQPVTGVANPFAARADTAVLSNMYRVSHVKDLPFVRGGRVGKFIDSVVNNPGAAPAAQNKVIQIGNGALYDRTQPADNNFRDRQQDGYKAAGNALPYAVAFTPDSKQAPFLNSRAMALPIPLRTAAPGVANDDLQVGGFSVGDSIADIGRFGVGVGLQAVATAANGGGAIGGATDLPRTVTAFPANPAANLQYVFTALPGTVPGAAAIVIGQNALVDRDLKTLTDKGDNLWLVTTHASNGNILDNNTDTVLQQLINRYGRESAEQWLFRNGYSMATNQRTGLGDITVNPMFEYAFSDAWEGSVYAHVLIPTGGSRKMGDNPYKARLGNDGHVELGAGANVAWQAFDWMNVRLDAMAAYALPAKERVNAPFKGATVKGIGPVVDADIDYTTLRGSLDTTLVHPKASALATTIGYDFCFKTKDKATLKSKDFTFKTLANDPDSWFGGFWDNAAPGGGAFVDKKVELDTAPLIKDTERISHNVRIESSWHATEQLSIFCGGSVPVLGQNVAKASEVHGGMNVKF